jgi:hypothetical protein
LQKIFFPIFCVPFREQLKESIFGAQICLVEKAKNKILSPFFLFYLPVTLPPTFCAVYTTQTNLGLGSGSAISKLWPFPKSSQIPKGRKADGFT